MLCPAVAHLNGGYGGRWRHPQIQTSLTAMPGAICRSRDYANLVAGDRKKKDTDALLIWSDQRVGLTRLGEDLGLVPLGGIRGPFF